MITPDEIRQKAMKFWSGPHFLRSCLEGFTVFPFEIAFAKPGSNTISEKFAELKEWLLNLRLHSKQETGFGYAVEYAPVNHRLLGNQLLPQRIFIETPEDFLKLIGKQKEFARFKRCVEVVLGQWPVLKDFLIARPHTVLTYDKEWDRLLAVCRYFASNPRPSIYMRQLDIPGVDTKFIEKNRRVLMDLLDIILPADALDKGINGLSDHGFERRFGLRYELPLIRLRLLDPDLSISGLTDLTIPLVDFRQLQLPVERVFIVENKTNGLCFPLCKKSLVIFGLGYGISILSAVDWLKNAEIFYWGDIDTHGFAILDRLRAFFPATRSFLMDEPTLGSFKDLWGKEDPLQRFTGNLTRLTGDELALFESLRQNALGECIRLEQERIAYSYLQKSVEHLASKTNNL